MKMEAISGGLNRSALVPLDLGGLLRAAWRRALALTRPGKKCLRLCQNLSLGERRFVAVVEYENTRFLLGGTASSLVLLARLNDQRDSGGAAPSAEKVVGSDRE